MGQRLVLETMSKERIIRFICNVRAKKSNVTVKKQQLEVRNPVKIEAVNSFIHSFIHKISNKP